MKHDPLLSLVAGFHALSVDELLGEGRRRPLPDARLRAAALLYACGFQEYSIAGLLNRTYAWAYTCRTRFQERLKHDNAFRKETDALWLKVIDCGLWTLKNERIERRIYGK